MRSHSRIVGLHSSFRFRCLRCDLCCGTGPNVTLTVFDVIRLSKERDVNPHVFLRLYTKVIVGDVIPFILLRGDHTGRCVFMGMTEGGETYCKVYRARPLKCRLYPLKLISPSSNMLELDIECPGVDDEGGEPIKPPVKLYKQYSWEIKEHYQLINEKVFQKGLDPLQALYEILDELWEDAKRRAPKWMDLEYLSSLGST